MAGYAILQEVDKCMRCRGCQVACQRVQGLTGLTTNEGNANTVQADDPMVVKAQKGNDSPPYIRYSCWHCNAAPCITACIRNAVKRDAVTGAVYVDHALCDPTSGCGQKCATKCHRGGYPKIGTTEHAVGPKAYKCDMCSTRATAVSMTNPPECVATCPGKALKFDTLTNIKASAGYASAAYKAGDGRMFWASSKPFTPPTTDPYIEDHITPMFGRFVKAPVAKALVLPTLLFGGLFALYNRRFVLAEEQREV